jgi:hypothetical protein
MGCAVVSLVQKPNLITWFAEIFLNVQKKTGTGVVSKIKSKIQIWSID